MPPQKLMVVDDEVDFADFVSEIAKSSDFEVTTITDPLNFEASYSIEIDVIILDVYMPHVDGIEILRFLGANRSMASIVFISGKDLSVLKSAEKLASEYGIRVLGILQKPFRAQTLKTLLSSYLPPIKIPFQVPEEETDEFPLLKELKEALDNKKLFLAYQPQIDISSRKVVGVEALVRWQHPIKGMIPPGFFIPLAEENFLIARITRFVSTQAIKQLKIWKDMGLDMRMSINMSPKVFDDLDLPENLARYTKKNGVKNSRVMIEVTETALMEDMVKYIDVLTRLRMKGFQLSIDDFGTGYSSLKQLVRAPFNELKIDQNFIRKLETDTECKAISEISILLAHRLGMNVVAEGVEDEKIWNILDKMGCDSAQGFFMGRPMSPENFLIWLKNWRK